MFAAKHNITVDSFHSPALKNAAFHSMVHRIFNFNLSDEIYGRVIGNSAKIILNIIREHEEIFRKRNLSTYYHLTHRNQSTNRISVPFFLKDNQLYEKDLQTVQY
jgi:hypothetical protein